MASYFSRFSKKFEYINGHIMSFSGREDKKNKVKTVQSVFCCVMLNCVMEHCYVDMNHYKTENWI